LKLVICLSYSGGEVGKDEDEQPSIFVDNQETLVNPLGDDEDMQDEH
jgi:hypothetical protein